jgi:hypothetical protein
VTEPTNGTLLAAVDNALRNGSHMTGANLAFAILCERLAVDRDALVFDPVWARGTDGGKPPVSGEPMLDPLPSGRSPAGWQTIAESGSSRDGKPAGVGHADLAEILTRLSATAAVLRLLTTFRDAYDRIHQVLDHVLDGDENGEVTGEGAVHDLYSALYLAYASGFSQGIGDPEGDYRPGIREAFERWVTRDPRGPVKAAPAERREITTVELPS